MAKYHFCEQCQDGEKRTLADYHAVIDGKAEKICQDHLTMFEYDGATITILSEYEWQDADYNIEGCAIGYY